MTKTIIGLMDEDQPAAVAGAATGRSGHGRRRGVFAHSARAWKPQLQKLVEPLRNAFAARSLQECQALVQRWKNIMASGGVTQVSPELMDEIKPVVAFVNEQTRREEQLRRFQEATKRSRGCWIPTLPMRSWKRVTPAEGIQGRDFGRAGPPLHGARRSAGKSPTASTDADCWSSAGVAACVIAVVGTGVAVLAGSNAESGQRASTKLWRSIPRRGWTKPRRLSIS